jgi:F420-dependent oxidoreductase-like protein
MNNSEIKFGIQIENQFGFDFETLKEIAITVEEKKYDSFFTCDHFFLGNNSQNKHAIEAYTMLSALATVTKNLKLGTLVTCMSYREPSLLAKILGSLDHISKGRVIIGLGAGWKEQEYNAYGLRFPPLKERMDRLEEGIQIIKKMLSEDSATFHGKYYSIKDAFNSPKPYNGMPPLLIGGTGEKRTLKMVAKYGDMSNFGFWYIDKAKQLLEVLADHCKDLNRDYNEITKTFYGQAFVSNDEKELEEYIAELASRQKKTVQKLKEEWNKHPGSFIGFPDEVIERYNFLIELGFTYFQIVFPYGKDVESSKRFADLVMKNI